MTVRIDGAASGHRAETAGSRAALLRTRLQQRQAPSGHQAITQAFWTAGITHIYALPGYPMYATLGACAESGLQVIGCRTRSGALSAALAHNYRCGAFRAVALCSPAPGVTNSITGLCDAKSNHWPMVLITALYENAPDDRTSDDGDSGPGAAARVAGPGANFQDFDGAEIAIASCKAVVRLTARDGLAAGHLLWPVQQPFSRMTLGQNGTIGLGIPFALGSAMAQRDQDADRLVVALVGDVGFGLSSSELETARRHGARLVVVVADNGGINGRVFQDNWFPGEGGPDVLRYHQQVDYAAIARGWGARAVVTPTPRALRQALSSALVAEGPTVISVPMEKCFPQEQTEEQANG
ncbi:thiamine pyrophosphate-dependent enzyme [Pseudophaeobacter flagellatus]|uniref:thiamine pyrophosphate-dependent enzyme n=1 Tax=Pseudophaeobacter flagellatus TaxID=2899119 RepID=UPI001E2BCE20|nr:thiamine pyrophosphate-dependent enzyme [Pseudophaeobacter flagellatus]MCD9146301.1 thiamine pyrophosphate-dependent enzyme [Pseudophaeobacter flagellatus]